MPRRATPKPRPRAALRKLLGAARSVRLRAYAPYSRFEVGAAVLADDGRVYAGCNVENSSYGLCLCAERNAMGQAIARGAKRIEAAAIVTSTRPPSPPCGMCLQTFVELGHPGMELLLASTAGDEEVVKLSDLMPRAFDRAFLADAAKRR